jgi:hypothetical protein
MGKAKCEENRGISVAINLFNKHANAIRKAENRADSEQVKKILLAGLLACQEAIVKLVRVQGRHQKKCDECKQGD